MKYLLLFIVAIGALLLVKHAKRPPPPSVPPRRPEVEPMHPCHRCGVHVPESRCVWRGDVPYCCEEHAAAG